MPAERALVVLDTCGSGIVLDVLLFAPNFPSWLSSGPPVTGTSASSVCRLPAPPASGSVPLGLDVEGGSVASGGLSPVSTMIGTLASVPTWACAWSTVALLLLLPRDLGGLLLSSR